MADTFDADCALCGAHVTFVRGERPTRETYPCTACGASLRHQGQALAIIAQHSPSATSIAELVDGPFRELSIWEPGEKGPFRPRFRPLPHYVQTAFWPDALPGEERDGLRCEDLMATTFDDNSFDLIVTSDIFEHVRKPRAGFAEVYRVLKPGGAHIFSIPVCAPMPARTVQRVNTDGAEDIFTLPPHYHNGHLVYNDFGRDLVEMLGDIGLATSVVQFSSSSANASRLLTFSSVKKVPTRPLARARRWLESRRAQPLRQSVSAG